MGNNRINSLTSSLGWTYFTTTITATITNPTIGSGTTQKSYYLQQGKSLHILFSLNNNVSTSTAGNGTYLFSIPPLFSIDTSIVSSSAQTPLGSAFVDGVGLGICQFFDSTHYYMRIWSDTVNGSMFPASSTFYSLNTTSNYSSTLIVPIL